MSFSNSFTVTFFFTILTPPKATQKIIPPLWKGCGIRQIYFRCLKYMLRFFKKLRFKFFCHTREYFWGYILFTILALQKATQKIKFTNLPIHKSTFTVWNTYYGFWQNCDLSFFCHACEYLCGNVKFLRCFHPKKLSQVP